VGIDGVSFKDYEKDLEANLRRLVERLKQKSYHARLIRRKYIPKGGGKWRPLGILVLEDKLVQRVVADLLNAIYEADFLPCNQGYRPGDTATALPASLALGATFNPALARAAGELVGREAASRGFNVYGDGVLIAGDFSPPEIQGGVNNTAAGAVISADFVTPRAMTVYLWHMPVLYALQLHDRLPERFLPAVAWVLPFAFLLAIASWYLIEKPAIALSGRALSRPTARQPVPAES